MLKFFRNIRQSLLMENKNAKYLKYAIGEIVLVVFGILIALQVNNWNEDRKSQHRKNILLKSLQAEFKQNLIQLDSVLHFDNVVVKSSLRFLHLKPEEVAILGQDTLKALLQNTSWIWTFDPLNGALRSGISSGDINLIKSEELKNLLFNWQDVVADAKENEIRALDLRLNSPVITKHVRNTAYRSTDRTELGASKFNSDFIGLINDPLFEDYISARYSHMKDAVIELNQVKSQNITILNLIERELENKNDTTI